MLEYIIIFLVGILVGGINGMAGGASVISYPVLLATGMSPVSAAISNALGVTPANFFALIAARDQMRAARRLDRDIAGKLAGAVGRQRFGRAVLAPRPVS